MGIVEFKHCDHRSPLSQNCCGGSLVTRRSLIDEDKNWSGSTVAVPTP